MQKFFVAQAAKGASFAASRILKEDDAMSQGEDPLQLPAPGSAVETEAAFFHRRGGSARPEGLHAILAWAPDRAPDAEDEVPLHGV